MLTVRVNLDVALEFALLGKSFMKAAVATMPAAGEGIGLVLLQLGRVDGPDMILELARAGEHESARRVSGGQAPLALGNRVASIWYCGRRRGCGRPGRNIFHITKTGLIRTCKHPIGVV